jgi:uncharacterized protein
MYQNIKAPLCATSLTHVFRGYLRCSTHLTAAKRRCAEVTQTDVTCGFMDKALQNWEKRSGERQKIYKTYLQKADKNHVLKQLPRLHEEAFEKIDCLQCANCCRNYSPRFKTPDIKRISRHLNMKEGLFIETYLRMDEDGDYVVKSTPCPFLGEDNRCTIYEQRPSDCMRFPYTDEDVILKRQALTLKNSSFCPIVFYVLENLVTKGK